MDGKGEMIMFDRLKGYRTYLSAAAIAAMAVANAFGYPIPDWVVMAFGAAGLGSLRAAVK